MLDVDARGRYEAELLRDEAARVADTETALRSMLAGDVVIPLVRLHPTPPRRMATRGPVSTRRRIQVLAGIATAAAVAAVLAFLPDNDPAIVRPSDTPSTELVVRPLDPPIACPPEQCPSLAASPRGTLVAYDHSAKTLTWYHATPEVVPVTVEAEQVRIVAVDTSERAYLLAGSPDTDAWELVTVDLSGAEIRRSVSSPNVERSDGGLVERLCWSGCEPEVRPLMAWPYRDVVSGRYPELSRTTGGVAVQRGPQRWEIAWPHTLDSRSQVAPRWDGGAVLTLVPESADAATELIELSPDGSVERFGLGDEAVHVLLPDGSAVVWRDGQLVRLSPPHPVEPWSPQLTAHALDYPIVCESPEYECPQLEVSPEGTLVAYDPTAATLTWYKDESRVVPISAELSGTDFDGGPDLVAIGPGDVAYFQTWAPNEFVAVAPSGAEITRVDWVGGHDSTLYPTASGLVSMRCTWIWNRCTGGSEWPSPDAALAMPWVDLDGDPITDPRPYPTARDTDAGIEVRWGEREWLLAGEPWSGHQMPRAFPRSDGGAVVLLDETFDAPGQPIKLIELSPDGTIGRYVTDRPLAVLPDGSVIVDHNHQLVRLTPPA
jgi:hypothetical protein